PPGRSPPARRPLPAPPPAPNRARSAPSRLPSPLAPHPQRAAPLRPHLASTVLARLAGVAKIRQVRIDRPLQRAIALADRGLHPPIAAVGAQAVELPVGVEHHRRPGKTTGAAGRAGMQPDHEERM